MEIEITRPLPGEKPTTGVWADDSMGASFESLAREMGMEV